jgi:pyruvate dehydrogenase E2 component (dihydrolipoamide acetyltransferase)
VGTETKVLVPDIGDFSGVEVIEVLVSVGDQVGVEDSLVTLESDKATMEIPSPHAGEVKSVSIKVGDTVNEGDLLLVMEVEDGEKPAEGVGELAPPEPSAEEVEEVQAPAPAPADKHPERLPGEKEVSQPPVLVRPSDAPVAKAHASPSVRRFARELGVDLNQVKGSGPKGRVTREDVQGFIKKVLSGSSVPAATGSFQLPAIPEVDFSRFGGVEEKPLSRIKKISGNHLSACWLNIPHVTQFDEADITELEAFRKGEQAAAAKKELKLTFMPFLMKACAAALEQMPEFNASLNAAGDALIYKKYFHIGVAVDTPNGLVVPVMNWPRSWRGSARGPGTESSHRPRCRAAVSPYPASAASAAPPSRPS